MHTQYIQLRSMQIEVIPCLWALLLCFLLSLIPIAIFTVLFVTDSDCSTPVRDWLFFYGAIHTLIAILIPLYISRIAIDLLCLEHNASFILLVLTILLGLDFILFIRGNIIILSSEYCETDWPEGYYTAVALLILKYFLLLILICSRLLTR